MKTVITQQAFCRSDEQVQAFQERWLAEVYASDNSRSLWILRVNRRLLSAVVNLIKSVRERIERRELGVSSHPRWSA